MVIKEDLRGMRMTHPKGYDDAINDFYEDVLDIKQFLIKQSKKEL